MATYFDFLILKEFKRQKKSSDYRFQKKKIIEILNSARWAILAGKILQEDSEFIVSMVQSEDSKSAIELQFAELSTSKENFLNRGEKFK